MPAFLDDLRADVRYTLRWCRRTPGFMLAAVLSLALGIGANTAIFSLIDAMLLRLLPVRQPEQLVQFAISTGKDDISYRFSYGFYQRVRQHSTTVHDILASSPTRFSLDVDGHVEPTIAGQLVSGTYYSMLGVPVVLGRPILPDDDDRPGAHPVAVLSDAFWERRFGRDPHVLGRTLRLNGYPFTVIGVSSPEFFGLRVGQPVDVSVPETMQVQAMPDIGGTWLEGENDNQPFLELTARLAPGVSEEQANAELTTLFARYVEDDVIPRTGPKGAVWRSFRFDVEPGSRGLSELRRQFSRPLAVLMTIVALVLLIACANVANLLLARATARQREIAVRVSLGASRGRLLRQFLTESVLLALAGGLCGLLLAQWASRGLAGLLVTQPGQHLDVRLDPRVLAFTAAVACATGLLFGIAPAISATRIDPQRSLADSTTRASGTPSRLLLGKLLVVVQVTLSLLLLVGAGLFVRTLVNLQHIDLGFERERVLALRLAPRGSNQKHDNYDRLDRLYSDLLERIRSVPGVRAASLSGTTPIEGGPALMQPIAVAGYFPQPGEQMRVRLLQIYPDYFSTLGIPLLAGREFTPADNDRRRPPVAVVNETLARRYFGGAQPAIGRSLHRPPPGLPQDFQIVGVVRDVRDQGPRGETGPEAYSTYAHTPTGRGQMTLLVRAAGDPRAVTATVRQYAHAIDEEMVLPDVQTIAEKLNSSLRQEQLIAWLSGFFGLVAVLLACIGLHGVMAYAVARRTSEFGVRLALGARRQDVAWLVLRDVLIVIGLGVAIGVPLALTAARLVSHMLFGIAPADPITLLAAAILLATVAVASGYLPARQAARVDPLVALRHE